MLVKERLLLASTKCCRRYMLHIRRGDPLVEFKYIGLIGSLVSLVTSEVTLL